jgi:hypothetical protein
MGMGFAGPMIVRPWDTLSSALDRPNYYGFQGHQSGPLQDAPISEPAGGVVYFDGSPPREDFEALLRLMRVRTQESEYAAFLGEAESPIDERFIVQVRLVSRWALAGIFRASTDGDAGSLVAQTLTVGDALWAFVEDQQQRWGTGMGGELSGTMGGDGDWAKEALAFGFMVENAHHGVYRLWSRAWLVTK